MSQNVFMDIDTIEPGEDFRKVVNDAVGTCDVVLVMIGKQWANVADEKGERRLENPRDWVRTEVATALSNPKTRVIPVLVRGASMPGDQDLPDPLKELTYRNAIELSDTRFQHDANKLIEVIERVSGKSAKTPAAGKPKSRASKFWGYVLGLAGLGLIIWPVGYALTTSQFVEGDWVAIPIGCTGIILTIIAATLLRRK